MPRFWDSAILEDDIPDYKLVDNKQIYTQKFSKIYKNDTESFLEVRKSDYDIEYYEFENIFSGLITVDAKPISIINEHIVEYQGNIKIEYKKESEDSEEELEKLSEVILISDKFTIGMIGRYDSMRSWYIVLNSGENKISLELNIGYYASILKADYHAKLILGSKD